MLHYHIFYLSEHEIYTPAVNTFIFRKIIRTNYNKTIFWGSYCFNFVINNFTDCDLKMIDVITKNLIIILNPKLYVLFHVVEMT